MANGGTGATVRRAEAQCSFPNVEIGDASALAVMVPGRAGKARDPPAACENHATEAEGRMTWTLPICQNGRMPSCG